MTRWERPAAGREPAAAALLGWLADERAPRLCLVSGSAGCGKSELLAWLVRHGAEHGVPRDRAVHAVGLPAAGGLLGLVWSVAGQLGIVARDPGEIVLALGRDHRRTVIVLPDLHDGTAAGLVSALMELPHVRLIVESRSGGPTHALLSSRPCAELDLDQEQWRDARRFEEWRTRPTERRRDDAPPTVAPDLSDPSAVCAADPWDVTAAYERDSGSAYGGLRDAWLRAGQALCGEQRPEFRALALLGVLGDGADPRLAVALDELSAGADWHVAWRRVRGDVAPPWPGPVAASAVGRGPLAGGAVLAGADDVVRVVSLDDAGMRGRRRLPASASGPVAMSVLSDGTVLVLGANGRVESLPGWATRSRVSGIAGLLAEGPDETERLLGALRGVPGTALAHAPGTGPGTTALGAADGTVLLFGGFGGSAALHEGPVRALASLDVPVGPGGSAPLFYSGGADGTVRAWSPGVSPMADPVLRRPFPVVSLAAAVTTDGPALAAAWGDGLVEYVHWDTGVRWTFRPGPPVRALATDGDGRVLIGMDEAVTCLVPRRSRNGAAAQPSASGD